MFGSITARQMAFAGGRRHGASLVAAQRFSSAIHRTPSALRFTYFDVLGVPLSTNITQADLQKNYHRVQAAVHPDVADAVAAGNASAAAAAAPSASGSAGAPPVAAAATRSGSSDADSATASKAYTVLKSDYARCRYISQLLRRAHDGRPLSDTRTKVAGDCVEMDDEDERVKMPPMFLMEIMELNEAVFTADRDTESGAEAFEQAKRDVQRGCDEQWERCQELWTAAGSGIAEIIERAKKRDEAVTRTAPTAEEQEFHDAVRRWTYYENLRNHIRERE